MARIRAEILGVEAILLGGSHARGDTDAFSDIDVLLLLSEECQRSKWTWFVDWPDGRLAHVSVKAKALSAFAFHAPEPSAWALEFAARDMHLCLWASARAHQRIGTESLIAISCPEEGPEVEDVIESLVKVRRATQRGDTIGLCSAAQHVGRFVPGPLRPFNPEQIARSLREALNAALGFTSAPPNYRSDLEICLGRRGVEDHVVFDAAIRLGKDVLEFVRARLGEGKLDDGDIRASPRDGRADRYLRAALGGWASE